MDFTSTGLINQIKRRGAIPTSQNLFTENDLLDMLNEELQNRILPYILAVREDYYLTYDEIVLTEVIKSIDIPKNAIGNKINQINLYNGNDDNQYHYSMPRLNVSQLNDVYGGYYIEGNKIKFFPESPTKGNVRIYYYKRPSEIVGILNVGIINTVSSNQIICNSLPSAIITGSNIDIVKNNQPWDTIKSTIANNVNVLTIDLDDTIDILPSYYVCLQNQSPFAQVPQDVVPLLIQAVIVRLMEAMGDQNGLQASLLTYAQMESDNRNILSPRVDNQPKKINSRRKLSNFMGR
jgi:hypothetical protein